MKAMVIGLDGATFRLLKPWAEEGVLPNLAKIMKEGCYGPLESSIPHVTYPAWKCYSTGKYPSNLGVYYFLKFDKNNFKISTNFSTSFKGREIWDYLGDYELKSGVINMPTTYPPKKINGFMISGPVIIGEDYVYPTNLKSKIENEFNYKPSTRSLGAELRRGDGEEIKQEIKDIIKSRFEVAKHMLKNGNFDFLHLTIFYIDAIQHFFWGDMEEDNPKNTNTIKNFWKFIDKNIGEIMEMIGEETNLIFISDHGFTKLKGEFNLNNWLINKGYLVRNVSKVYFLYKLGLNADLLYTIFKKTHLLHLIRKIIPTEVRGKVPSKKGDVSLDFLEDEIDWQRSKAIMCGDGLIYINNNVVKDDREFKDLLIEELRMIRNPVTGEKFAEEIYKTEEIYGHVNSNAPDIFILPKSGYLLKNVISEKEWNFETERWSAIHELEGIFIAYGPDIKKNSEIKNLRIYDIAPTILHLYNIPIPQDVDGRVIKNIFQEDSEVYNREVVIEAKEKELILNKIDRLKGGGRI
ncbi:MAG: alkaline phosphatase family protein [Halobacteriota archaeon]|nr:alkaline phosphatase family protein [Halobacteriota archaeon]